MIRINLLAAERPAGKKKAAAAATPGALQAYLFLGLFGGGALAVCGGLWWIETQKISALESDIGKAKKRQQELQAIKAQVEEYENQKRMLDAKVKLIEQLQRAQSGPVHMLDEFSKALPDFVWLAAMDQTGAQVRLKGESNSLTSVADLITSLQRAGSPRCSEPATADRPADRSQCYFNQVELVSSVEANNVVSFELSANFLNAWEAIKAAAAPASALAKPAADPAAKKP